MKPRTITLLSVFLLLSFTPMIRAADAGDDPLSGLHAWLAKPHADRPELRSEKFADAPLTKDQAKEARQLLWDDHAVTIKADRQKEWDDKAITAGNSTLKFLARHFGEKPKDGWNLYISMHGGGNAPPAVNDQQWENQIKLYQPKDSLYIAPRAPTNGWDLWHEPHIDPLFDRLIEDAIVLGEVDPNHVYIMGYSAGGDGVYQLAPRMADRWAAASMMAGHPNDASPLGLRNIGFAIHVGALDNDYDRNKIAAEWGKKLDDLQAADPKGYAHQVQLHEGRSHWMNLEDKVAVDWIAGFTRDPLPTKVVWKQSKVTHGRFYWLAVPADSAKAGDLVVASRDGQSIDIEKIERTDKTGKANPLAHLTILLNDKMLNLDQPVKVTRGGHELFNGKPRRTIAEEAKTLAERGDPDLVFDSAVEVEVGG